MGESYRGYGPWTAVSSVRIFDTRFYLVPRTKISAGTDIWYGTVRPSIL